MTQKSDLQIVDLFAGPGGLGTGFAKFFQVTQAIDIDRDACDTYAHNHKETRVKCQDVRDETFARNDYQGVIAVIGGPPCQDFSQLNKYRDPKSPRASLLDEMLRAIREIKPRFALIENVFSVPRNTKVRIEKQIRRLNYRVVSRVVNACDFGSVQIRKRWILTACRKRHVFPTPKQSKRKAREILTGTPSKMKPKKRTLEAIQTLPVGKWAALPGQKYKAYFVVDPDQLLPAVVNPTKLRYIRPDRTGYLSFEELYRAQGFPQSYKFCGNSLSSKGQQLANAVPVELAEAFAREFQKTIVEAT